MSDISEDLMERAREIAWDSDCPDQQAADALASDIAAALAAVRAETAEACAQMLDDHEYRGTHHDDMCKSIQEDAVDCALIEIIAAIRTKYATAPQGDG